MAQSVAEYANLAREAERFAKMCADFPKMGSGEFKAKYPDYNYDGRDHVSRHALELAGKLRAFVTPVELRRIGDLTEQASA